MDPTISPPTPPTTSGTVVSGPQPGQSLGIAPTPKPSSGKKWMIVAVIVVVVVLLAGGGWLLWQYFIGHKTQSGQNANSYYDRPGFDRKDLSPYIGDPQALTSELKGQVATYQGTQVIQACSVLRPEDIHQAGLQLKPDVVGSVTRSYFEGTNQTSHDSLAVLTAADTNTCAYAVNVKNSAAIRVNVYQSPYATGFKDALYYYDPVETIEGMQAYKYKGSPELDKELGPGPIDYLLWSGGQGAYVKFIDYQRLPNSDKTMQTILHTVAKNFMSLRAHPGNVSFAFNSPLFTGSYLRACDVLRQGDILSVFNAGEDPLVSESIASAIGRGAAVYSPSKDPTSGNYVADGCSRKTAEVKSKNILELPSSKDSPKTVQLLVRSYTTATDAKAAADFLKSDSKKVVEAPDIGEGVYFSDESGENPSFAIPWGRYILTLSMNDPAKPGQSDQSLMQVLTPLAKGLHERVKGL